MLSINKLLGSGPQPLWHPGLVSWKAVFARGGGVEAGDGSGGRGGRWGAAGEASLPHLPLTSCCVARFLTAAHRPVLVRVLGVGGPALRHSLMHFQCQ